MKYVSLPLLLLLLFSCQPKEEDPAASFPTAFEQSGGKETATYTEVIDFYIAMAREFPEINIQTVGETDSGRPLHVVTYNPDSDFNFQKIGQDKLIILINNGIHPGESDGIDASMLLFRDYATGRIKAPEHVVLVTIPVYNVGGALNRNTTSRVNQNGPESYGFRGNAKNYDLNRDFIKMDSRNAETFAGIFHTVKPDLFIDTHVSNGADYQYTLTHLFTQPDKLGEPLGSYLQNEFIKNLSDSLLLKGHAITPYVNVHGAPPDEGFIQFLDSPRYSTGYAALWQTPGVMLETHMLKPYEQRVRATYDFLLAMVNQAESDQEEIRLLRAETREAFLKSAYYPQTWTVDSTYVSPLEFQGFQADTVVSGVTGLPRLQYNRSAPYTRTIPYRNRFVARDSVEIPRAYVIKKSWGEILRHLELNGIQYRQFGKDTSLMAESYRIAAYQTVEAPFEGHYPHYNTLVQARMDSLLIEAGDYWIPTAQKGLRYLLETLEPGGVDSFFNWNFFDTYLQQKEGYSEYVFEDLAETMLVGDSLLRKEFEMKRSEDPEFAASSTAQLDWIYLHSPYYEEAHLLYPVYRILKEERPDSR